MRTLLAAAIACLILVSPFQARSSEASTRKAVSIPAQELSAALQEFAQKSKLYLIYDDGDVVNHRTAGASGELTQEEVLKQLLQGTGLTYKLLDNKTLTIVPIGTAPVTKISSAASGTTSMRLAQSDDASPTPKGTDRDSKSTSVQEIVVTAQKREERLQDVPISISVMTGKQLDTSTLTSLTETLNRFPGVVAIQPSLSNPRITIRGAPAIISVGGTVGYYVDSVPFGFAREAIYPDMNVYDFDRIEVLRGPQGTLYGANSVSGVIRLLTKDPDLSSFEAKTRVSGASVKDGGENYRADAAVNLPIVEDRLAIRLAGGYQDLSGWIDRPNDKDANRGDVKTLRTKLKAQPTEALSLEAGLWFSRTSAGMQPISLENRTTPVTDKEGVSSDFDTYSFTAAFDFGGASLTSATSYIDFAIDSYLSTQVSLGTSGISNSRRSSGVFFEEINLQSMQEGPWRWSIGAMYRDAKDESVNFLNGVLTGDFDDRSESAALFGEATRKFLNGRLEATLGLRYFHDEFSTAQNFRAGGLPLLSAEGSDEAVTPRAVLAWHPSDASTLYVSYAQGFRSGLSQHPNTLQNPLFAASGLGPVGPDKLSNYEIGAKATLFDGRLSLENAVYYMDWQDIKTSFLVPTPAGLITALANGPSASGAGVDLAITFRPIDGLEVGGSGSWNDLVLDERVVSGTIVAYNKGDRLTLSPETTASGFVEFSFPVGGLTGSVYGSVNYISSNSNVVPGPILFVSDPMTTTSARFTIESGDGWSASLFGDNLGDESGMTANNAGIGPWQPRIAPRTVGLQLEYHMGK